MKTSLRWIAAFSVATNFLLLVPPLYMLQLYDRVLSTRSMETLFYITLIALAAMALFAAAEVVRSRLTQAAAAQFAARTGERLFAAVSRPNVSGDPAARMRDYDEVRTFLGSRTFLAVFDLPFAPLFIVALALLHPLIGLLALAGCGVLAAAAWLSRSATKAETDRSMERERAVAQFGQTTLARADEMRALGLFSALRARWSSLMVGAVNGRTDAVVSASFHDGVGKFIRKALQIVIMGSAAWLVVRGDITGGVIFAASMLTARALAPVEGLITGFDAIRSAHAAHKRVSALLGMEAPAGPRVTNVMRGRLEIENVSLAAGPRTLLNHVSLTVEPGRAVCVAGASGAGKTLLARIASGALVPTSGAMFVDGIARSQWSDEAWSRGVGTMPQDVVLFPGTVAESVSRFDPHLDSGDAEAAQRLTTACDVSGATGVVRHLADGFATRLGPGGAELSSGERALVALARALYAKPRLLILDEPLAHLDEAGETKLLETLRMARERGCAIFVLSNHPALKRLADEVLELCGGRLISPRPVVEAPSLVPEHADFMQEELV